MRDATASAPAWDHEQAENSPETLLRHAMRHIDERGLNISPSKARRLIRGHLRTIGATPDERDLLRYLLSYADPTGESAAANVDRGLTR